MKTTGLSELDAAVAVANHRNFRAAAVALGVSASALSHAVSSLETRLGVRLFNRTTRSVSLTEAGENFLAKVEPALHEIAEAMDLANEHRDTPTGTLKLNASDLAVLQILRPLILAFTRRFTDMSVEIVTEGRLVDIVADGFDAGIRLADDVPLDMVSIPLGPPQRHIVVGAPAYLAGRKKPRSPADLAEHICIRRRLPSGAPYKWELAKKGQRIKLEVSGPLLFDNHHLVLSAALAGAGLAYVNEWAAHEAVANGKSVQVLADWTPPYPGLCLYYPGRRRTPAGLRAFIAMIQELGVSGRTAIMVDTTGR